MSRRAEVIATGAELLQGRTLNRHGHVLGGLLAGLGVDLVRETVLPDDPATIRDVIREALARSELVFVTGGLGPTDDDLTREAAAEALGRDIVHDAAADAHLEEYFARIQRVPSPAQRRQALVLAGAEAYQNPVGIAPGQHIGLPADRHLWLLPGPPREMQGLIGSAVAPWLRAWALGSDRAMAVFRILGHSESALQSVLRERGVPASVQVAYCARPGSVELRFTGPGGEIAPLRDWVRGHYADDLLNESGEPAEVEIARLLTARGHTICTAESFTAGGISERLTDVPGSSAYFLGGAIAYANGVKVRALKVPADLIARNGAVSEPVAASMAEGARARFGTDWALAVTGIAGPGGGSPEKPVGLFYIGLAGATGTRVVRHQVAGDRAQIREHGVQRALEALWRALKT